MKSYLIAQDLWSVVQNSSSKSIAEDSMSQNSKVMALIILSCEDHIIRLLNPDESASIAWKKLEQQYGNIGFSAQHLAFKSLVSTHISSCQSVDHFIDQFRSNIQTLSQMTKLPIPQWLLLSLLINNVGSHYEAWSQSIMQQIRLKPITEDSSNYLEEIIASLIDEARRSSQDKEKTTRSAMMAKINPKLKPICVHCRKVHMSNNCWQRYPEKRPMARYSSRNLENSKCNKNNPPSNVTAFLSQKSNEKYVSWILDSSATHHMCNDSSQFTNIEENSRTITIANNSKLNAAGKGDIRITTKSGNTFTLLNVLYVPQLASNLLSISCALKNPLIKFNFEKRQCQIISGTSVLANAVSKDSHFIMETLHVARQSLNETTPYTWDQQSINGNEEYRPNYFTPTISGKRKISHQGPSIYKISPSQSTRNPSVSNSSPKQSSNQSLNDLLYNPLAHKIQEPHYHSNSVHVSAFIGKCPVLSSSETKSIQDLHQKNEAPLHKCVERKKEKIKYGIDSKNQKMCSVSSNQSKIIKTIWICNNKSKPSENIPKYKFNRNQGGFQDYVESNLKETVAY